MAAVPAPTVAMHASALVRDAVARMLAAPRFFTQEEWNALASYEGPIVSGDPQGPQWNVDGKKRRRTSQGMFCEVRLDCRTGHDIRIV